MFNKELSSPSLQSVFDHLNYITNIRNDSNTARTLAIQLKTKIENFKSILRRNIETFSREESFTLPRCCSLPPHQLKHDSNFGVAIKPSLSCSKVSGGLPDPADPQYGDRGKNVSSVMEENLASSRGLLWQYLISREGEETVVHPAFTAPLSLCSTPALTSHSQTFLQTLHRQTKNVVFVLDTAAQLSPHQFRLSLDTVVAMVGSLSSEDRVAVLLLSPHTTQLSPQSACTAGKLTPLSQDVRTDILTRISEMIQEPQPGDLADGILQAQRIIRNSDHRSTDGAQIIVISGRQFRENELETDLTRVQEEKIETPGNVSLSFVLVENVGERIRAGRDTLMAIISAVGGEGRVYSLSSSSDTHSSLADWYQASPPSQAESVLISSPRTDLITKSVVVSFSQSLPSGAVVGIDVALSELIEDLYWVEREQDSRMFLIDVTGLTLAHPALALSDMTEEVDITSLEPDLSSSSIIQEIKTLPSGSVNSSSLMWTWQRVEETPYVVVIATSVRSDMVRVRLGQSESAGSSFQYHSLVTSSNTKLCRHLSRAASMQTTALYLSPAAFARPADHLGPEVSPPLRTQSYMAYLTDPTRLIANPGLRLGVRDEAQTISRISLVWREQAYSSPMNNYIVRRRVASPRGVEISYPGALVSSGTDPTLSSWYRTATEMPDLLTVTGARLDSGGAGYVVTLSQVLTGHNTLAAVISADMTQGYFTKILNDTLPDNVCNTENISCFLMDHHGYLITHSRLDRRRPAHITDMEPALATDLLTDRRAGLVTKSECRKHSTRTKKRIYTFNLDYRGKIESQIDVCTQYSISRVLGTNLFLGVVNKTCSSGTSFCWCSTVDNSCLDCSLMSQEECECPCECRDRQQSCSRGEEVSHLAPTCPPEPETVKQSVRFSTVRVDQLPPCIRTDCSARLTAGDCLGVLGCEWCQSWLPRAQCVAQEQCWGGVLGAPSPYSLLYDQDHISLASESDRPLFRASPIGPVAGGIMAFFILLALSGWGYRHWSSRERRLLVNTDQDRVIMEGYEEDISDDVTGGHNNYGLHHNSITVVSPYRMNPSYRRPRPQPGTDSDHGYSTMTPYGDQDSEIMSCLDRREKGSTRQPVSGQSVTSSPVSQERIRMRSGEDLHGLSCSKSLDSECKPNKITVAATIHMVDT